MATFETPRMRRVMTFVCAETERVMPGSAAPLAKDYARMIAQDHCEADILAAMLEVVPLLAETEALQKATDAAIADAMRKR